MDFMNIKSRELYSRIIKRDLRAGFSVSTINKVFGKILKEAPYMRCSLLSKVDTSGWDWVAGVFSQTKMDGMFCNLSVIDNETVVMSSRQGTEFPIEGFVDLVEHTLEFVEAGYQYHGELVVIDPKGAVLPREIGNGILNSVLKGGVIPAGHYPKFIIWDMVHINVISGAVPCKVSYRERLQQLMMTNQSESFEVSKTRIIYSLDEAYQHYQELLAEGQEGSIIKNPNMLWRDGTSKEQLKLKLEFEVDLKIVGFTQGNGKNANTFGSISMESSDGLLKVDVSGMSDDLRMYAHLHRDDLLDTIATVKANDITKSSPASLYLPRLVDFRSFEKSEADSFERIVEQLEAAKRGGK
jgi:DNA ligase-1